MTAKELAAKIAGQIQGTCKSLVYYLDEHPEIDMDDLEDALLDEGIEKCKGCGWWFEVCELCPLGDDDEPGYCDQCREDGRGKA